VEQETSETRMMYKGDAVQKKLYGVTNPISMFSVAEGLVHSDV
jgi:hypothetical protein